MSADTTAGEGFLRRWARLKSAPAQLQAEPSQAEAPQAEAPQLDAVQAGTARPEGAPPQARPPSAQGVTPAPGRAAPTLEDVARLTPDSDYSAFVAQGVDKAVQRMALKKLFADPNFAVMDGLDIYIADYNKASPLSDAMLATLRHAPGVLDRLLGEAEGAAPAVEADTAADTACASMSAPALESEVRSEAIPEADREPGPAADNRTATTPPQTLEPGTA